MQQSRARAQRTIDAIYRKRGYVVGYHKLMAMADPEWLAAYETLLERSYFGERTLDRKTKELLQTVVLAAQRAEVDHIASHVRQAVAHGATHQEVLEALECVLMPLGALGFNTGLAAWAKVAGVQGVEPSATATAAGPEPTGQPRR